ncbi:MAG TPA: zf-TFIIB domain-containing protein [bacterium]|nr:zf-TFIIB domain-containing protein [bacterium]
MLRCPVCAKVDMAVLELNDVEIDYCFDCGGIWLDAGELELLMGSSEKKNEILSSFQDVDKTNKEKKRACPICRKPMKKVIIKTENGEVLIDECAEKHGIWFDKGELYQIISCSSEDAGSPVLSFLRDIFCSKQENKEDNK